VRMATLLGALLACTCPAAQAQDGPPAALKARMQRFGLAIDALDSDPQPLRPFFPRRGEWTWAATIHHVGWPDTVRVHRYPAEATRGVIGPGGEVCESFWPEVGDFGAVHDGPITYLHDAERWRAVSRTRFVAQGDSGDAPSVFVEWRREDDRWVVSSFGDRRVEFPRLLGVTARSGLQDPIPYAPAILPLPADTRFARGLDWFENNEPVLYEGRRLLKYGLPRALLTGEVTRVGSYQRIGVFAETGAAGIPEVVYLPVSPVEFQPYQLSGSSTSCLDLHDR
jgi:hypothetical protein